MAPPANERRTSAFEGLVALLAPFPGRLEFAARLALICTLTTLVAEIYQTPEPALTAYVAFFVTKQDRAESVVISIVMLLLITLMLGFLLLIAMQALDEPLWRVTAMALISFCLTFAASASKLKPVAGTIALITAYALDVLGTVPGGETATRGVLWVWVFVAIPAGVSIAVNLILGPAPRRLAERALAHRLQLAGAMLRAPDARTRKACEECLREGAGEIPAWLKRAGAEKTSPSRDITALQQAAQSTVVILSVVDFLMSGSEPLLPVSLRKGLARTFDSMAAILGKGEYPVDIALESHEDEAMLTPLAAVAFAELRVAISAFAEPSPLEPSPQEAAQPKGGFFLPDAFTNPAHVQYALKTTGAAMFCYVAYLLLDWPGIHTCLITCYIVSLGTTAETVEKQTLRFIGCLIGAAIGLAAIVFLMPDVTSIGALLVIVFLAALVSGWIAAGSPRISYAGFQLAFVFFLCVIQGSAPAFDMTIARDRTIGILFGDLVVAVFFTMIWPVSVAGRIDPAVATLFRRLAALASAASKAKRWALTAEVWTKLGAIEQDLELIQYEPSSIRPAEAWLDQRREVARTISSLQGPLLIGADQDTTASGGIARRLDRLAESFGAGSEPAETASEREAMASGPGVAPGPAYPGAISALMETPLAKLEQLAVQLSEREEKGRADYAPA
jgi:multidrug resistance protein MdtO